jgi:hypothetical protein
LKDLRVMMTLGMLDSEDYPDAFLRLEVLEREILQHGLTVGRLAARANLELALGNIELALQAARELQAMSDGEAATREASRIIQQCTHALKVEGARREAALGE